MAGTEKTADYRSFRWMRDVCYNQNTPSFKNFGAAGITVHWDRFKDFKKWLDKHLGPRPAGHLLGRKDKYGDFAPGNLRWETPTTRSRHNPRQNVLATYRRQHKSLAQWADDLGIPYHSLRRKYAQGFTIKEIIKDYK
jgi:hypothetical protein